MWTIDLSFLQESASIFLEHFINKYYRVNTYSGKTFLIINTVQNYPHLVGIKRPVLGRLKGSEFLFDCILQNDTSVWTDEMKKAFNRIYPNGQAKGVNDIKITFFPLMPEIFVRDNYILSVNFDRTKRPDNKPFNTEVLISDFNEGMNIGMVQRDDNSFGFNSWRVEENEEKIMEMYHYQEIDLIKSVEQFKGGKCVQTKTLSLTEKNLWRLSRLKLNYESTFSKSPYLETIDFLSNYSNYEYDKAFTEYCDKFLVLD